MFQTIDNLRIHFMHTLPDIGAHEAHILACRALQDAYLDAPADIRLLPLPASSRVEVKHQK